MTNQRILNIIKCSMAFVNVSYILAADQASVDLVYALKEEDHKDLVERIETRHGLRQLTYMNELGMGNTRYKLVDIDNDDKEIAAKGAVVGVKPFVKIQPK